MSSAEYYLENHIDQFYRILFFILELRARGISSDEDDVYPGPLPYNVVPEETQIIVYNDNSYRNYLLNRRQEELRLEDVGNVFRQNLVRTARVREEDLMMLMINATSTSRAFVDTSATTKTTTTTTTTTTATLSTSTTTDTEIKYHQSKKVKYCYKSGNKFYWKNYKLFFDEVKDSNTSTKFMDSCLLEQRKCNVTTLVDKLFVLCSTIQDKSQKRGSNDKPIINDG